VYFAFFFSEAVDYAKFGFDFIQRSNQIGPLFHNIALQQYILLCAQVLEGGLRDKPGKNRDHYHSCYCLSGLSVSQYSAMTDSDSCPLPQHVLGPYSNLLEPIHPLYNVVLDKYHTAYEFFSQEWWCEILEQSWLGQMSDGIVCTDTIGPKYCDIIFPVCIPWSCSMRL